MAAADEKTGISRRTLIVGGGVAAGLVVAWTLWPRSYAPNLRAREGETLVNAFLKIGNDGRVVVAVPQAELGQGSWTALPQILADELGADWRTVAVEPAPLSPLYANLLLAEEAAKGTLPGFAAGIERWSAREYATRGHLMMTHGSTSVRAFEERMREAGAGARALLAKAAARRWQADWETLDTVLGFVINGAQRLSFAELAADAAKEELPEFMPIRGGIENRLVGQSVPRIDLPAKVDGSARFAGDVRLRDMVFASVRSGPGPDARLVRVDKKAAQSVPGVTAVFENPGWAAVAATNWWAADKGLQALKPAFERRGDLASDRSIAAALDAALAGEEGRRVFERGETGPAFDGSDLIKSRYSVAPAPSAPLETLTATARLAHGHLEVWAPTQAPGLARAAAARAAGMSESDVTLYPMLIGGGYGRKMETQAIEQAATMAAKLGKPVQLAYSRLEETLQDGLRAPAAGEISARVDAGMIVAWKARIAAPDTGSEVAARIGEDAALAFHDDEAAAGAVPPYSIPDVAVELAPAQVGVRTGLWRSGAHSYTAFFTESFIDELARMGQFEPLSFRMQMLGDNPRLARCLSTAAALGGWDGGGNGSSLGLAGHSAFGSHIGLVVEIDVGADRKLKVVRAVAAVDCGRVVNPNLVRQQVEGGILFAIGAATGAPLPIEGGRPAHGALGRLELPRLATSPEVTVEIVDTDEPPGGVTELAVPPVAPAIANALHARTGERLRSLPLRLA